MVWRESKREREEREKNEPALIIDLPAKKTRKHQTQHQCDEELAMIPKMAAWKPWDVKAGHTVELRIEKPVE